MQETAAAVLHFEAQSFIFLAESEPKTIYVITDPATAPLPAALPESSSDVP
jgi:hypothetical protein